MEGYVDLVYWDIAGSWRRKIACENDVSSKAHELGMVTKFRPKVVLW